MPSQDRAALRRSARWLLPGGAAGLLVAAATLAGAGPAPVTAVRPEPLARRAQVDEKDLRASLWRQAATVVLDKAPKVVGKDATVLSPVPAVKDDKAPLTAAIRAFVAKRDDLRGLPLAAEKDCRLSEDAVKVLREVGGRVRPLQAGRDLAAPWAGRARPSHLSDPNRLLSEYLVDARKDYAKVPLAAGPLRQVFEVETPDLRTELVGTLRALPGEEATRSLARLASFDLSPRVRKAAITALKGRPAKDARPVFLAALRHPWAPAADHAAHALVELGDRPAVPALQKLLDEPAPDAPFKQGGKWVKRELVRVNHLRNCFLCHPPAEKESSEGGGLVAPVPAPGHPLPESGYYGDPKPGSVRADVVYYRPDFSAMHTIPKRASDPWPATQRFDYLVRTRELTKSEADELLAATAWARNDSPQRRAVKDAIAALSRRKDAGPTK